MSPNHPNRSRARRLVDLHMVEWADTIKALDGASVHEIETDLSGLIDRAVRLSAYLAVAGRGGRHETAVAHQNSMAKRVRKALGYAYPDQPVTF